MEIVPLVLTFLSPRIVRARRPGASASSGSQLAMKLSEMFLWHTLYGIPCRETLYGIRVVCRKTLYGIRYAASKMRCAYKRCNPCLLVLRMLDMLRLLARTVRLVRDCRVQRCADTWPSRFSFSFGMHVGIAIRLALVHGVWRLSRCICTLKS